MTTQQLTTQIKKKNSFLCIGLDVDLNKIPKHLLELEDPILEFSILRSLRYKRLASFRKNNKILK